MKIKIFASVLFFLLSGPLSYAQWDGRVTKIYSGYLHKDNKDHSFLGSIFGRKPSPKDMDEEVSASLEFQCPAPHAHQPLVVVPETFAYGVKFRSSKGHSLERKDVLGKFVIKVYTNDGEEYLLDPNTEGEQAGPGGKYHIDDSYLIYLMLGQDIHHFEIVSVSEAIKDKYVLDKLEIKTDR
jgi:hypothetical protein